MKLKSHELWLPDPHPKQVTAFESQANEILYGGATRGGKSFFIRWSFTNWAIAVPGLQADIFRLNFDDVIADCMDGHFSFPELLNPLERRGLVKLNQTEIKFWNGSLISLEHASTPDKVMLKHQGIAKHVRAFIEATQLNTSLIKWLRAWVTMPEDMKNMLPGQLRTINGYEKFSDEVLRNFFPRIVYASNSIGPSASYFRKHFVKAAPSPLQIFTAPIEDGGFRRQYIPAKVEDNPSEDAAATRRRVMGMGDPAISDALLNENWDAPVGEYYPEWDDNLHSVPNFTPPDYWFKFRTFDWGSADPFAVLWFCVADGTEFKNQQGELIWFPRGALIAYREWYGCRADDGGKGIAMPNHLIAQGIVERTLEKNKRGWVTITDSFPFRDEGMTKDDQKYKIATVFAENGCPLILGNTARVHGWKMLRDRLKGKEEGTPLFYATYSCRYLRDYIPQLQRHKVKSEDAAEDGEATHICDCARLACTTWEAIQDKPAENAPKAKDRSSSPANLLKRIKAQNQWTN